jgi:PAS domain S-box-containing protein
MMMESRRLLTIDDEEPIRRSIRAFFEDQGWEFWEAADGETGLSVFREKDPDVVLVDLRMPGRSGLEVIDTLAGEAPETPVVVLSGTGAVADAIEAIRRGAWDYVSKPIVDMAALEHVVEGVLERARLRAEVRQYHEHLEEEVTRRTLELRESEEKYRTVVENSNDAVFIAQDGVVKFPNTKALDLTGYSADELARMPFPDLIHPDDREMVVERHRRRLTGEDLPTNYSFRIVRKDGNELWGQLNAVLIAWDGRPATLNVVRDFTEQRRLEAQLQQAQKMEAIGTLAGGIAHDFNNILTPIIVRTEIALLDVPPGNPIRNHLEQVLIAAERAGELVRQILTFSRQGEQKRNPLRMGLIIKEALKFLRSSLPTTIEIHQEITCEAAVMVDPTEIHQVIMNLCTNAAHAMRRKGGLLDVRLDETVLGPDAPGWVPGLNAGPYQRLSVRDTGTGMESWMLEKIFDPYFTTKDKGEGTGLGLAVVHGIVASLGGTICVESRPGEGSLFTVFIPAIATTVLPEAPKPEALLQGCGERVLLVDDEEGMLEAITAMLRKLGYEVDFRTDPREALDVFRANPERYDAVITDQTMPGITGAELAAQILHIRPDIPIILCTGYSELVTDERAKALGIREFVMKPIVMREMARTIRRALEGKEDEGIRE